MIFADSYKSAGAMKSALQQYIAANRVDATSQELTRLYATSSTMGSVADFRAEMMMQVPMRIKIDGKVVDENHTLYPIFKRGAGYSSMMKRTELALYFWGRNLLWKDRNAFHVPRRLTWVNPNVYWLDAYTSDGLRGFRLSKFMLHEDDLPEEGYIPREDAVYEHEVDFDNDFDGVSPAERACLEGASEPEKAQMLLSTFRNMGIPMGIVQPAEDSKGGSREMQEPEQNSLIDMLRRITQGATNAGRTIVSKRRYDWKQMQSALKDMDLSPIAQEVRESICIASRTPLGLIRSGASNYAEFEGLRRTWADSWLVPRAEWHGQEYTEQLAADPFLQHYIDAEVVIEPDFDAVPFLKENAASRLNVINAKVQGGIISLYEAQIQAGETAREEFRDLYHIEGIGIVPISEVPNAWRYNKFLAPTSDIANPSTPPDSGGDAPPPLQEKPKPFPERPTTEDGNPTPQKAASQAAFMCIMLPDHADLQVAQYKLKKALEGVEGIDWQQPDTFHITLAHSEYMPDEFVQPVLAALRSHPAMCRCEINGASLGVFENDGERSLYLAVEATPELKALQAAVYQSLDERSVPLSPYSEPDAWKPHITLARLPAGAGIPDVRIAFKAFVSRTVLSRDEYQVAGSVALARRLGDAAVKTSIPASQWKELNDWRSIVGRKGANYAFKPQALPATVAAYIQLALQDGEPVDSIFDVGYGWLSAGGIKAYTDTRAAFVQEMLRVIGEGQTSEVSRQKFGGQMRSALRRYGLIAFRDGMNAEGYDPESFSSEELTAFRAWQEETSGYISGLGDELFKEGGISENEVSIRADMWAEKSLREVYYLGAKLAAPNKPKRWKRNPAKDSCEDCISRDGQVKTLAEWEEVGLPGSQVLACHGYFCGCDLEDP